MWTWLLITWALGADRMVLPVEQTGGATCLDPDSERLRDAVRHPPSADTPLDAAALARDVDALADFLEHQYSGWGDWVDHPRVFPERYFAQWAATLRGLEEVSLREGVLEPLVKVRRVVPDNHLNVAGTRLSRASVWGPRQLQAEIEGPVATDGCELVKSNGVPRLDTLSTGPLLTEDGQLEALSLTVLGGEGKVVVRCGAERLRLDERPPAPPVERADGMYRWERVGVGQRTVAVIELPRLTGSLAEHARLEQQLLADRSEHLRADAILVDLRGNGGGSDSAIWAWARGIAARVPAEPVKTTLLRRGRVGSCQVWNYRVVSAIAGGTIDAPATRGALDALRGSWKPLDEVPPEQTREHRYELDRTTPFEGRVVVLVDRHVGSAGEGVAVLLQAVFGATLVGERTAGRMEHTDVTPWVMPETGVLWSIPTKRARYAEPRESVGIPVDVWLSSDLLALPASELAHLALE